MPQWAAIAYYHSSSLKSAYLRLSWGEDLLQVISEENAFPSNPSKVMEQPTPPSYMLHVFIWYIFKWVYMVK